GEAAAARAAERLERLGASRERGGGARRDGAGGRDRGARVARRSGRGREPVVAPRPLRRRRARPRHGRGGGAPRLARGAPLARAARGGASGRRCPVGGGPRALARLGSRLSRPGREPPHAGRRARRDLFLGLLAYNIGPRNGGLRAIMEQYGARDFATIQPYLNTLPRDYPIRVLSAALAYRLWRTEGRLPRYEDGTNALHIQGVGVPGLVAARD